MTSYAKNAFLYKVHPTFGMDSLDLLLGSPGTYDGRLGMEKEYGLALILWLV